MVTLRCIFHSGFLVETPEANLVFDYWREESGPCSDPRCRDTLPRFLERLDPGKPLRVFVSHHHKDHLNQGVFDWGRRFRDVRYFLSKDTERFARHRVRALPEGSVEVVRPLESVRDPKTGIEVSAFRSTDIGNSWVVDAGGFRIFHAGDLNSWTWLDESTPDEIKAMDNAFRGCVEEIKEAYPELDLAMFPVDGRLGRGYERGARHFLEVIRVRNFVPMHCGLFANEEERMRFAECASDFAAYANPERGTYAFLGREGDSLGIAR